MTTPRSTRSQTQALARSGRGQATAESAAPLSEVPAGEEPVPSLETDPEEEVVPESEPDEGGSPAKDNDSTQANIIKTLMTTCNA